MNAIKQGEKTTLRCDGCNVALDSTGAHASVMVRFHEQPYCRRCWRENESVSDLFYCSDECRFRQCAWHYESGSLLTSKKCMHCAAYVDFAVDGILAIVANRTAQT